MNDAVLNLTEHSVRAYIEVRNAYDECDPEIQQVVDDMLRICRNSETDAAEKDRAMATALEALFPSLGADLLEIEKKAAKSEEAITRSGEMDREEEAFAERLQAIMQDKGLTQEQLAEKVGIGQSAISNMLKRQCRPQQRTVAKFAEALGVPPSELWPKS